MLLAWLAPMVLGARATPPPADDTEAAEEFELANDPIEPTNRTLFDVNTGINRVLMGPLGYGYRHAVPQPVRDGIHNALENATSPIGFANHVLQGKPCRASDTLLRLVVNSTFGIGGLIDVGAYRHVPRISA